MNQQTKKELCQPCEALRSLTGGTIRPGKFSLTKQGIDFCQLDSNARVLDAGCGSGESVEYLTNEYGYTAIGIDSSVELLAVGKARCPSLPIHYGVAGQINFANEVFELVLTECAFSNFLKPDAVLREFNRVLTDKGWLIISDMYIREGGKEKSISLRNSLQELLESLSNRGFELVLLQDHSEVLRDLTAKLIWKYGSMEQFKLQNCKDCTQCSLSKLDSGKKAGYYLLIAQKDG